MKFNLIIDNEKSVCKFTGKTARIYREQFGSSKEPRDLMIDMNEGASKLRVLIADVLKDQSNVNQLSDGEFIGAIITAITPERLEQMLWSCLYVGSDEDFPLYNDWLDSIEDVAQMDVAAATCYLTMHGDINPSVLSVADEAKETEEDDEKKSH